MSTILVIDDSDQIRGLLRAALEIEGYEVIEASDGVTGVRKYQQERPDLVIADIVMPEQDGLGCMMELRQLDPDVRIIAISGGSQMHTMDVLDVASHLGASRVFRKPFDVIQMVAAVGEVLAEKRRAA